MFYMGQCWRGRLCYCRTQGRYRPQRESLAGNNVGKLVCSCDAKGRSWRFAFPLSSACSVAAYAKVTLENALCARRLAVRNRCWPRPYARPSCWCSPRARRISDCRWQAGLSVKGDRHRKPLTRRPPWRASIAGEDGGSFGKHAGPSGSRPLKRQRQHLTRR